MATYPRKFEVPQHTAPLATHYASVPDLRRPGVAVHLGELELSFGPRTHRKCRVADDVP